jgi:acyl-coenzyme A synthetase/AMP-(fatty) acid ligase
VLTNCVGEGCDGVRQRTFAELYDDVARLAAAMKAVGVQQGDRVVGLFFSYNFAQLQFFSCLPARGVRPLLLECHE